MRLTDYTHVHGAGEPVLTVHLDVSRDTESGAAELELRWRGLREELVAAGTPDDVLDLAGQRLLDETGRSGGWGRMVVVGGSQVLLDRVHPGRPASSGRWAALPHLMPLLEAEAARIPYIRVLADREGADITVSAPRADSWSEAVDGTDHPIHRSPVGGWSQRRFQQRVENAWEHNAADVADRVEDLVRTTGAQLLAVAGDVRALELLEKHLGERGRAVLRHMYSGGRGEGISAEDQDEALDALVQAVAREQATATVELFLQEQGQHDRAASRLAATVEALRKAQVETLVVPPGWDDERPAWFGTEPAALGLAEDELRALGTGEPRRGTVVDVMERAAVGTDARLVVAPAGTVDLAGEPAAVLRWSDAGTNHG